jgi:peptidyl-prolyl cis-trans isomerase D
MLQILRNKAQSTIIQSLVLIIALVFIFWGVGTNMTRSRDAAISVNDEEISFQEFQRTYDQAITGYRQQFGDAISDEILKGFGVKQQVINQLTQTALLRQGAQAMGIMVAPTEIQTSIQKMAQFHKDGVFNIDLYKSILAANRLAPHNFETSIGHDLLHEKGITFINNFATIVSDAEINEMYQQEQETLTVGVIKVTPALFTDQVVIDPEKLADWFEKEKNSYKSEQKIKLKYLSFPFKAQMNSITVSDEQALAHYEKNKNAFQTPEKRQARHILFKTEADSPAEKQTTQLKKAEEILAKARAGEDFAALAKTWSEDASKSTGGDLGTFARGRMIKEFDDAVFSMEQGGISDIVKTQFGYHIIKVEKIQPAITQSVEQARPAIITTLQTEQAKPAAFQVANTAYEEIIAAGSLQAYAEKHAEKEVGSTDFFSRTVPPDGLDRNPQFMDTVFALKQGELSSLVETPSGYFILFAEGVQEPAPPTLDEVKERASKDFTLVMAKKSAAETAAAILTKVQGGADFEATAKDAKMTAVKSGPLRKNNSAPDPALPASLVDQALRLGVKTPFPKEALAVGDDLYILQFLERKLPDATSLNETAKKEYTAILLKQKQDQLLGSWLRQQEKNARILISKNLGSVEK